MLTWALVFLFRGTNDFYPGLMLIALICDAVIITTIAKAFWK